MNDDPSQVQARINDYWSDRAPAYDDYQQRPNRLALNQEAWSAIWRDVLPPAPVDVLDVGTGSGYVALVLARLGHRVTGIDLAPGMLERAREHAHALPPSVAAPRFEAGDAVNPDYGPESFDVIAGRYVAWTLRHADDALAAWWKLLRPGGSLALVDSTWYPDGIHDDDRQIADAYNGDVRDALPLHAASSIDDTADLVRAAGYTDVTVTPLHSIYDLDQRFGVAPGHDTLMQYLVRARRP